MAKTKKTASNEVLLVDAAIRCFKKVGVEKSYIEDIAREAGLSRPTAYRTVGCRNNLLELVTLRYVQELTKAMEKEFLRYNSFSDALVFGTIETMKRSKSDLVYMDTLKALGDLGTERYLLNPNGPVPGHVYHAWIDTITKGRADGFVRDDITDDDIVTVLNSVNCLILLRDDLSEQAQEYYLRKFLLPAIMPHGTY